MTLEVKTGDLNQYKGWFIWVNGHDGVELVKLIKLKDNLLFYNLNGKHLASRVKDKTGIVLVHQDKTEARFSRRKIIIESLAIIAVEEGDIYKNKKGTIIKVGSRVCCGDEIHYLGVKIRENKKIKSCLLGLTLDPQEWELIGCDNKELG